MRYLQLAIIALGCVAASPTMPGDATALRVPKTGDLVITRIVSRHDVIVVRAGNTGATYSLEGKNGETIVPATAAGHLAMRAPELSKKVQTMQANTQWAGIDTDMAE